MIFKILQSFTVVVISLIGLSMSLFAMRLLTDAATKVETDHFGGGMKVYYALSIPAAVLGLALLCTCATLCVVFLRRVWKKADSHRSF